LLKEKLSLPLILAAVGLYAANFVGGASWGTLSLGHVMVLAATLLWSAETILVKRFLAKTDPDVLLIGRMGIGSLFLLALMLLQGKAGLVMALSPIQWLSLLGVSVLLFGYVTTWYRALKFAPASAVASILVGATVITSLLSSVATGRFTTIQAIQGLIISGCVAVVVILMAKAAKAPTKASDSAAKY
jgi:drug/metabolite transporter (DMT)-like permease